MYPHHNLLLFLLFCRQQRLFACQQKADLIIHNATIYTLEENQPKVNSIVIEDGVITEISDKIESKADKIIKYKNLHD